MLGTSSKGDRKPSPKSGQNSVKQRAATTYEDDEIEEMGSLKHTLIVWCCTLEVVVDKVPNVHLALSTMSTTEHLLQRLGFGSTFVMALVARSLQCVGLARGSCRHVGTGSYKVANWLVGYGKKTTVPPIDMLYEVWEAMLPTMKWLVAGTLGKGWCVFVTWQMFVGLCCEGRKYLDQTRERLRGSNLRAQQYLEDLKVMCFAYGIDMAITHVV